MNNRSYWVDYAKAIGILLVVYAHVVRGVYNAGIETHYVFYGIVDSVVYSFVMPLFFFLSGMFFYGSFSKRGARKLINSKIDTIVYPYIVWSIVQGMIEVSLSGYTNGDVSYAEVFSLLWSPRAQFWFLYALFMTFLLASIVFLIVPKKASMAVFLLAAMAYIFSSILPKAFLMSVMAQHFVFFALGIVFSLHFKTEQLSKPWILGVLACAFFAAQFMFHLILGLNYLDFGIASLALAIISIFFIISLSMQIFLKPNPLIVLIGSSSMAIYLIHVLAGGGARVLLKSIGIEAFVPHVIIGCLAGLFIPLLFAVIISRLRIRYIFSAPISRLLVR